MPTGPFRAILFVSMTILLAACASSTSVTTTYSDDAYANASFDNFLVIAVAGDYNSRAQFERTVVSGLRTEGASAEAYYSVVGGNKPINSEAVLAAVRSGNFDAMLVTRVIDQQMNVDVDSGPAGGKSTNIGGNPLDFFRYEYEELNEPEKISFNATVVLRTELFATQDEKMIWSIESSSTDEVFGGLLIEKIAAAIVDRLAQSEFIGK